MEPSVSHGASSLESVPAGARGTLFAGYGCLTGMPGFPAKIPSSILDLFLKLYNRLERVRIGFFIGGELFVICIK